MQAPAAWVVPLSDSTCADPANVGGKAAQLHALVQAGFAVPAAWVVTLDAFESHLGGADRAIPPERPAVDALLEAALKAASHDLSSRDGGYLAVRSSALGEDGATVSFAGQHATYYYVTPQTLAARVIDCWLSLWSQPAQSYRATLGTDAGFGMAVIVQDMVQAERAGVCFSRDPTRNAEPRLLIEATWGLGAALVDGRVSPDRYRLDAQDRIVEQRIGRKRLKVAEQLDDPTGTRLEAVPAHQRASPVLDADAAAAIAAATRKAEALFGAPQDLEWAYTSNTLWVLQSRPITGSMPMPAQVQGRRVLFKPIAENLSGPLTPMTVDLFRRVLPPFGQFIRGRFYVDADALARLLPFELPDDDLRTLLLLRPLTPPPVLSWRRLPAAFGWLTLGYLTSGIFWHRSANAPLARLEAFAGRCARVLEDPSMSPLDTLDELFLGRDPLVPVTQLPFQLNVSAGRYFIGMELLSALLRRLAPAFDQDKLSVLLNGGSQMLSRQMVDDVRALAEVAREDPAVAAALRRDTSRDESPDASTGVAHLEPQDSFSLALQAFLRRYGHRAIGEVELMTPRWREDSTAVLQMVMNYLDAPPTGNRHVDPHGLRLAYEDELHQSLGSRWQRRLVDSLVARIRYYVTLRENTRYYHTMAFATVRAKLIEWEQALIDERRLRCPDDVFFLEWRELLELREGLRTWRDVEPAIKQRRRRYQQEMEVSPPESFNMGAHAPRQESAEGICHGDCASPGVAEGRARVILDPTLGVRLAPGEILVAPYTDPAWTPLFPSAAAVIVEVGSYLSHAGTVAREYQIPCLVDVADCTERIHTGTRLRVNASEGWVAILAEEA